MSSQGYGQVDAADIVLQLFHALWTESRSLLFFMQQRDRRDALERPFCLDLWPVAILLELKTSAHLTNRWLPHFLPRQRYRKRRLRRRSGRHG